MIGYMTFKWVKIVLEDFSRLLIDFQILCLVYFGKVVL